MCSCRVNEDDEQDDVRHDYIEIDSIIEENGSRLRVEEELQSPQSIDQIHL